MTGYGGVSAFMTLHPRSPLISPHFVCQTLSAIDCIFAQLQRTLERALAASRNGEKPCGSEPGRCCWVFAPCRQARSCCLQRLSWPASTTELLLIFGFLSTAESMVGLQGLELGHSSAGELGARREFMLLPSTAVVLHPPQRRILKQFPKTRSISGAVCSLQYC